MAKTRAKGSETGQRMKVRLEAMIANQQEVIYKAQDLIKRAEASRNSLEGALEQLIKIDSAVSAKRSRRAKSNQVEGNSDATNHEA